MPQGRTAEEYLALIVETVRGNGRYTREQVHGIALRLSVTFGSMEQQEYMVVTDIPAKKTGKVRTEYLDFDASNPRLVEEGIKKPTDSQIVLALADVADLGELVESIAANG